MDNNRVYLEMSFDNLFMACSLLIKEFGGLYNKIRNYDSKEVEENMVDFIYLQQLIELLFIHFSIIESARNNEAKGRQEMCDLLIDERIKISKLFMNKIEDIFAEGKNSELNNILKDLNIKI